MFEYNQVNTEAFLPIINKKLLSTICSPAALRKGTQLEANTKVVQGTEEQIICEVKDEEEIKPVILIRRKSEDKIQTSCRCEEKESLLCAHKIASLLKLNSVYGDYPFEQFKNWDDEKERLLSEYGYSLKDDITDKFDFEVIKGRLTLVRLDLSISKVNFKNWKNTSQTKANVVELMSNIEEVNVIPKLAYVIRPTTQNPLFNFDIFPCSYQLNDKTNKPSSFEPYIQSNSAMELEVDVVDFKIFQAIKKISLPEINNYATKNNFIPKEGRSFYNMNLHSSNYYPEDYQKILDYSFQGLCSLFNIVQDKEVYFALDGFSLAYRNLERVELKNSPVDISFSVSEDDTFIYLNYTLSVLGEKKLNKEIEFIGQMCAKIGSEIFPVAPSLHIIIEKFNGSTVIKVRRDYFSEFFKEVLQPLAEKYSMTLNLKEKVIEQTASPQARLYLKELDKFLLFMPTFNYQSDDLEKEVEPNSGSQILMEKDGKVIALKRDLEVEKSMMEFYKSLHTDFQKKNNQNFFYVSYDLLLKEDWFFDAFEKIQSKGIEILGFNNLTKLKYNYNKPKMHMGVSSGIDWFDVEIKVSFGDQFVSLKDISKAIFKKESFVRLGDGTLGLLPEEWLKKYSALFKHGKVEGENLKISKRLFSIVNQLYDEIDDQQILRELQEKKTKLMDFKGIEHIPVPKHVNAQLRDYQLEGLNWLNFLNEFGWGGCLADDMGLGKTLQILAFLQHQKNLFPESVNLVVVPTTLIFNWKAEAEKFCPELKIYINSGKDRLSSNLSLFKEYDIILTTYGVVRADIEHLIDFHFHYIILDESQTIKNPGSQVAKAVKLLKANNRIVMTGTPIENNTFDLYSQIDFINPGLLGSQEFFRSEYSTPIDKNRDAEKAEELKKIIYPFLLKRTKEEVAKDLPDKTETILYCEMGKHQRKVYEGFKNKYKDEILNKIEEEGLNKTGFLILEGMLKLRQICDSPVLLSDQEDYGNESIKLEELTREITENAGDHKILIFSQFLKMLDEIKNKLTELNINYEYLDGQTKDRQEKVNNFQSDKNCKVFLISLKAGGVGINLTEADYVYLIDPWWNPAVEQQAIDRTHRIGQTKKVFAYKMICKDSIEEKILLLQEKKKSIAQDLISTENGFMKKLTKEDVVFLFS